MSGRNFQVVCYNIGCKFNEKQGCIIVGPKGLDNVLSINAEGKCENFSVIHESGGGRKGGGLTKSKVPLSEDNRRGKTMDFCAHKAAHSVTRTHNKEV